MGHGAGAALAPHAHRPQRRRQPDRAADRAAGAGLRAPHRRPIRLPRRHRPRRRAGRRRPAADPADRRRRHPAAATPGWSSRWRCRWPPSPSSTPCSGLVGGWLSRRIGEGLIFDLRTHVFGHVQRQSLAFFTRTQTGALVSPAQQRRDRRPARLHLHALEHRLQHHLGGRRRHHDAGAELAGHAAVPAAVPDPAAHLAAGSSGRLAGLTREQMDGNADMGNAMTERFNVGGAMLLKLFGRRDDEDGLFAPKAGRRPRPRRPHLAADPDLLRRDALVPALALALVYGIGGHLAIQRRPDRRHPASRSAPCCCACSARCRASPTSGST